MFSDSCVWAYLSRTYHSLSHLYSAITHMHKLNCWVMQDPQTRMLAGNGFGTQFKISNYTAANCCITAKVVPRFKTTQDWEFGLLLAFRSRKKNDVT